MDNEDKNDNKAISYRQLANLYFEGSISQTDAERLFSYLEEDETHVADFRRWESEWMQMHDMSDETRHGWSDLEAMLPFGDETRHHISWHIVVGVAASVAVLLCIVFTFSFFSAKPLLCSVPNGGRADVVLPDGSRVSLNAGSQLSSSSRFGLLSRKVYLQGEALFDVAKRHGAPFTVKTTAYDIVVKGTRFNVSSYNDENIVTTKLFRGKVEIRLPDTTIVMKPGQRLAFNKTTNQLTVDSFATDNLGWVEQHFEVEDMPLSSLARKLSRQYGVDIYVANKRLCNVKISMHLNDVDNVDDIMSAIEKVVPVKVQRKGKQYYID